MAARTKSRCPLRAGVTVAIDRGMRVQRKRPKLRRSVGLEFILILGLASAIIFGIAAVAIVRSIRCQDAAQAEKVARASAARTVVAVQRVFEDAFAIVAKTHDDLLMMKAVGVQDPLVYDTLLQRMLDGGQNFGAWLIWDGKEAATGAAFTSRLDNEGRFAPYLHQNGMEVLRDAIPPEIITSDLYRVPRQEGRAYLAPPHAINAIDGEPTLVTSFSRPLQQDGRTVGVLAIDVKLDAIVQAISALELPSGAKLAIVAGDGMVAAASDAAWIGKPLATSSPGFASLLDRARSDGDAADILGGQGRPVLASWQAVRFGEVKNPWFVLTTMPQVSVLLDGWADRVQLLLIAGAAMLTMLVVVLLVMYHLVSKPLRVIGRIINDLGSGLFGMTIPDQGRADEIGDVARAVVRLRDSALEIARMQEENGEREYQKVIEREKYLETISSRFSASIETVAASLRQVSSTVGGRSSKLTGAVEAAALRLADLSRASTATRDSMHEAAAASAVLLSSINIIGAQSQLYEGAATTVRANALATDASLADLALSVKDIGALVELIASIAAQINLIALNATIEAARAGEEGRGFAVVAQEVKTLAGRTSAAADAVTIRIKALKKSSDGTHASVFAMQDAFLSMRTIAQTIAQELQAQLTATGAIASLVDQAQQRAEATARTAEKLSVDAQGATVGTGELQHQSHALDQEVETLNEQVARFVEFLKVA